jgi:predicted transcriptional regulator
MERLSDLYFELSNEMRLAILFSLREKTMNLTSIAKRIDKTTQECSRHTSRLAAFDLIQKKADGKFSLTPYGRLTLRLLSGQLFASSNHRYFNTHTLDHLPSRIVSRIHELNNSRFIQDIMVTFSLLEDLFKEAKEYIWMIHDQYLLQILPLGVEALKRGVRFRSIDPFSKEESRRLDAKRPGYITAEDEEYLLQCGKEGSLDVRLLEDIQVFLYVTEKKAIVAFPLVDGSFDYKGFATDRPEGLRLYQDIFEHYWSLASKLTQEKIQETHITRMQHHARAIETNMNTWNHSGF